MLEWLKNIGIKLSAHGPAAVIIYLVICVTTLGLSDSESARKVIYILNTFGVIIILSVANRLLKSSRLVRYILRP